MRWRVLSPRQQRQGKQQSADELAGHVARQLIFAAFQSSFNGQARRRLFKAERLLLIQLLVYCLRAFHQPSAANKGHFLPGEAGNGDEKAQGASALTAVHRSADGQKAPQTLHDGTIRTGAHFGAELPGGGEGGRNILAEFKVFDVGSTLGQRRAEHRTVRHALAGRRGDGAADAAGGAFYRSIHITYPGQWPMRPDGTLP